MSKKILISSCLIGENVRFDGRNKFINHSIIERWQQEECLIAVCPEVAGGLGVPREPCEIIAGTGIQVLQRQARVVSKSGFDHTDNFISGAHFALELAQQHSIKMAILKKNSPSCGNHQIYDGTFSGTAIAGAGVAAALLQENGICVFNETELEQAKQYHTQLAE